MGLSNKIIDMLPQEWYKQQNGTGLGPIPLLTNYPSKEEMSVMAEFKLPLLSSESQSKNPCSIEGCDVQSHGKGYCKKHYIRAWRGNPMVTFQEAYPGLKQCSKCKTIRPDTLEYFVGESKNTNGVGSCCRQCLKHYQIINAKSISKRRKIYWEKNKDRFNEQSKQYRLDNPDIIKEREKRSYWKNRDINIQRSKQYYENNKEIMNAKSRQYGQENKEKISEKGKEYRQREDVEERMKIYRKEYYQKNADEIKEKTRIWSKENRDRKNEYNRTYNNENPDKPSQWQKKSRRKAAKRPSWRINCRMSSAIRQSLNGNKDGHGWESLVGYTVDDLKKHLEKRFIDGMTWENIGDWHIDHEIPQSVFNFKSHSDLDFKKCWALSNLQPMWAKDNRSKGAKLEKPFQPSFAFGGSL